MRPAEEVAEFPAWETLPHERLSPRSDTVGRRLDVLRRLAGKDTERPLRVVTAPVRSVLQPVVEGLGDMAPVRFARGEELDFDAAVTSLAEAAYARVDMVTRRGEFAVRGGIIDVFSPIEDHPVRIEFFGDEVDELRWFAVADQRTLTTGDNPERLVAPPCREVLITPSVMSRAAKLKNSLPGAESMLERIAIGMKNHLSHHLSSRLNRLNIMRAPLTAVTPKHRRPVSRDFLSHWSTEEASCHRRRAHSLASRRPIRQRRQGQGGWAARGEGK